MLSNKARTKPEPPLALRSGYQEKMFSRELLPKEAPCIRIAGNHKMRCNRLASPTEYTAIRRAMETRKSNRRPRREWWYSQAIYSTGSTKFGHAQRQDRVIAVLCG